MQQTVVPMIHVPDVRAAIEWYESIGFAVAWGHEEDGEIEGAAMTFGGSQVMFNCGGRPSAEPRREVDLYIQTDDVEAVSRRLRDRGGLDVVEAVHDTFYGMRELIIRDLNGFWITFGQPIPKR